MKFIIKLRSVLVALSVPLILSACVGKLTFPDPPAGDIDRANFKEVTSSACGFQLVQLLPLGTTDRQGRAYQELVEKAQGAYLGDIQITEDWYYGVIGSVYCTSFKAKAFARKGA